MTTSKIPGISKTEPAVQRLVFQPTAHHGLQSGIDQIASAIRPTLGPLPRTVAIDPLLTRNTPEVLDSGGVIARRIIQLKERDADMGAMLARGMICHLHDQFGDGTATAAVLLQTVYAQGVKYLAAGGDAMRLREHLECGAQLIVSELARMTTPAAGKDQLTNIALSVCADPPLAALLGEIFDVIGGYGQLEVRSGRTQKLEREYIEGMHWKSGLFSREMIANSLTLRTEFENPAILITDLDLDDPRALLPIVESCLDNGIKALVIVARHLSDVVSATFALANKHPEKLQLMAVRTPGTTLNEYAWAMDDLAILTGGKPLISAAGDTLRQVTPAHFGRARRAWATPYYFGLSGGKSDPRRLRQHIAMLKTKFELETDAAPRQHTRDRIGKLMGGAATLWVGAATENALETRKALAQRAADTLRRAVTSGVLPGGGTALRACRPMLEAQLAQNADPDLHAAYRILLNMLSEPTRIIVFNAGYDVGDTLATLSESAPGCGFDAISGRVVDMVDAGILDAADVQKQAVYTAITTAALALTVDVLVHHRKPQQVHQPG